MRFDLWLICCAAAVGLLLAGLAERIAPWLARLGRWFNRVTGATFVGIGAALTTANR